MEFICRNKGTTYEKYCRNHYYRSDMTSYLIHLTKPNEEDLKKLGESSVFNDENKIEEINKLAADNLIRILKSKKINGSGTNGFVVGGSYKKAACFQNLPFQNLQESVKMSIRDFKNNGKLRYCGVGIAFSKVFIYQNGGRPVLYEETGKAKEILSYNKDEYWRIVNLKLEYSGPQFDGFDLLEPIKTNIIDFTYEREWRVPNELTFDLVEDAGILEPICFIFPNKATYKYFLEQVERDRQGTIAEDALFHKYDEEEIYRPGILERDNVDQLYEYEIYNDEFYNQLFEAREYDNQKTEIDFENIIPNERYQKEPRLGYYEVIILDEIPRVISRT